jgi:hypothetical protein
MSGVSLVAQIPSEDGGESCESSFAEDDGHADLNWD